MALDYFGQNIESLVNRIGRDIVLRTNVNSGTAFDPNITPSDVAAKAAAFDYGIEETDGSIIKLGDKEFVIASTQAVDKNMIIVDGGINHQIIKLEEVGPGDEVLMYIAQGRS